jgi:hypothetical protein
MRCEVLCLSAQDERSQFTIVYTALNAAWVLFFDNDVPELDDSDGTSHDSALSRGRQRTVEALFAHGSFVADTVASDDSQGR